MSFPTPNLIEPKRRILLVDDDEQFRKMLRKMLVRMGFEVIEARNGKEAIEIFQRDPADLVMTDIIMPEKEGLETIGALKRKHPGVKIVAMSGGGRGSATDYLKVAMMMGADRTIPKPFSNENLETLLANLFGES
jgi:YesN/AraC family two-component response regulator